MDVKVHVVELVSHFLCLKFVRVLVKDLGEDHWYEEYKDSKSEGPFLVINVSIDGLRVPNRELSSDSDNNLDITDINCSDG